LLKETCKPQGQSGSGFAVYMDKKQKNIETRQKILLLDDETELLEMYKEVLSQLPSKPEIHTASSGSRAMALLEDESFRLLICDLKMPKMDGLQVLSIVRRKFPQLRTVAITAVNDEQFRSRTYALGVDQFWQKPGTEQEIKMFLECIESLLGRETNTGFRGLQSKSLVDIIQLECISQSSSLLRITNATLTGKIWIQDGELVDAEAGDLRSEAAFAKILSWRNGSFENLPPEPSRTRTIFKSYNALLLESAQAIDESRGLADSAALDGSGGLARSAELSQIDGIEFVLAMKAGETTPQMARGLENPQGMVAWSHENLERFRGLGERLHAGPLEQIEGLGQQRHVVLTAAAETEFCVGWKHDLSLEQIREMNKKVLALWVS
jgi:CheY-like chemotaxis protein